MTEYILDKNFWTYDFYNKAINHIDEKIPIVVPSYNRYENNIFLDYVRKYMVNDTWPIYVIVRQSQKKLYEANYGDLKSVTFVAFKDEEIDDIGKTRNKMISYFSKKYDTIFNLDDDSRLMFKANAIRHRDNNIRYSRDTKTNDICKMFAMWQLTHEYLCKEHPNCWITYLYNEAFIFDPKYGTTHSYSVGGLAASCVCINLDKLKKYNLNYLSIHDTGHEDIDLVIRAMKYKLYPISIKFICSRLAPIGGEVSKSIGFDDMDERLLYQNKRLYELYGDSPYITLNKHQHIKINWNKFCKDNKIIDKCGSIKDKVYKFL